MSKFWRPIGLIAFLLPAWGCVDIEQSYTLRRDLSGTAEVRVTADFESFARAQAFRARSEEGKPGDPSQEEIEEAIASLSGSLDVLARPANLELMQAEARKRLPAGIQLLDYTISREARRAKMVLGFAFDDVFKVSSIKHVPTPAQKESGARPSESPFSNFQVKDEGETLLVYPLAENAAVPYTPFAGKSPGSDGPPSIDRFAIRIEAPFEVVATNATRREGTILFWDYDAEAIAKTPPEVQAKGFWVRYKK